LLFFLIFKFLSQGLSAIVVFKYLEAAKLLANKEALFALALVVLVETVLDGLFAGWAVDVNF
jgi:hypothetical protein